MLFGYYWEGIVNPALFGGLIFFIVGMIMRHYPPRWPNFFYGYRTMSSLRTKATFDAANTVSSSLMVKYGIRLIMLGAVSAIFFHEKYWWLFLSIAMVAVVVAVIVLVSKTEKYLAKHFDKHGYEKN